MEVDLPRPRSRKALLAHKDYYAYREELLDFLEAYEGGANPDQETLDRIRAKRGKASALALDVASVSLSFAFEFVFSSWFSLEFLFLLAL